MNFPRASGNMVLAVQGATNVAILSGAITKAAWHDKPSWFVVAGQDRTISPEQEASTAKRMGAKILTLASSHLPMLSHPDKVAQFVIDAAGSIEVSAAA